MTIQPIVEGYGEVEAVPALLRRLRDEAGAFELHVGKAIRRPRSQLVKEAGLRASVRLALLRPECDAVLILFDSDDDCPKHLAPQIEAWAQSEAGGVTCAVVLAQREYEAWFLAAIESLRGMRGILPDAVSHPNPEIPRGAKGQLEERMFPHLSYSETTDQSALTALFNMATAHSRCRSFRRMVRAFGLLAIGAGAVISAWPPPSWQDEE